jgi:hypothetical protein
MNGVVLAHLARQLIQRTQGNQPAMVHDADPVAQLLRLLHVVRRVEHGHALLVKRLDVIQDVAAALRVDADSRLIHDDQWRFVQQRYPDVHASLHAPRVGLDPLLLPVGQTGDPQNLVHPLPEPRAPQPVHLSPEVEVLPRRQVRVKGDFLRHDAEKRLSRVALGEDRATHHPRLARRGLEQARQHRDSRALSRAIRPQQAEDLALPHLKAHLLRCLQVAKVLAELDSPDR